MVSTGSLTARDSDKIIYYWKRIEHAAVTDLPAILGLQGATSTTNQRNVQSTQTKTGVIKSVQAPNQTRVVDVIMTDPKGATTDIAKELYNAWQNAEVVGLWRLDLNTLSYNTEGKRQVDAEFSKCLIGNLPETEGLGAAQQSNITFDVIGVARRYDSNENPYHLTENDLPEGAFDSMEKFYNFAKGTEVGIENGAIVDKTTSDAKSGVADNYTLGPKAL